MAAVKNRDTGPELALRKALHGLGLRYRVHPRSVPGRPDLANQGRKLAIFVDGDFWHANPADWRRRGFDSLEAQFRADNRDRWVAKLQRNVQRDREVTERLESEGWQVLRFWASEVREDLQAVVDRILQAWSD